MSSVVLREVGGLHEGIGGEEAAYLGIIQPRVGINRLYAVVVLMAGEAAVEGVTHVVVAEVSGVAPAAPGVIALPLLGVAVDGGREAPLVVLQRVVHGSPSVLCYKDSEDSRSRGKIVQAFCHAVHGDGLVKRREVTLGLCRGAVAEGLYDALPVDVVVYGEPVAALADGVHLVERGVGDILVGKVVDERCVGTQACHRVWIGGMLVAV